MEILRVFISQPMTGLTDEQIIADREAAAKRLQDFFKDQYEIKVIDNLQTNLVKRHLEYLGYDIACMVDADLVYFIGDYINHRGCLVEEFIAQKYGYNIAYDHLLDKFKFKK